LPLLDLQFVYREFTVRRHRLIDLLIALQLNILSQKLKDLFDDVGYFVFDLIEYPVIVSLERKDSGILEINQVTGSLGLREIEDFLQVGDTHFTVRKNQM
jgi:hypothetical protein